MPICPCCQRRFPKGITSCPECDQQLSSEHEDTQELVCVHEPPDEMTALALVALLEEHGIEAVAKSEQIAMYDGLALMMRPKWGKILVLGKSAERASGIIAEFLAEERGPGQKGRDETDSESGED